MTLGDDHLWKYVLQQDRYTVEEFGIGIVGIGALFWAYGTLENDPYVQLLIAFIGLGGSLILWMHILGAFEEYKALKDLLRERSLANEIFFQDLENARGWRTRGKFRLLYHSVTRLMQYFMLLISMAWLTIIFHNTVSRDLLIGFNAFFLSVALVLVGLHKVQDIKKRGNSEERIGTDRIAKTERDTRQLEKQVTGECFQRLIRKHLKYTVLLSFLAVVFVLVMWYFYVYVPSTFPINLRGYNVKDLVGIGLQRQLSWGVVGLTLFFGFFQFLGVVHKRKNSSWLFKAVFVGFMSTLTFSITKIADHYRWIAELERQGDLPVLSPIYHEAVLYRLPIIVSVICLTLWFVFLCLFIERITRNT